MVGNLVWIYLVLLNAGSLVLMGFDKMSAEVNSERVPEKWFFLISLAGGFVGVILGMFAFRHKTRKMSFQLKIATAAILATLMLVFLATGR
ncbi:MAG: DUF1294 domain-containing protein [Candidatus Bathyarchaeia archaeon]